MGIKKKMQKKKVSSNFVELPQLITDEFSKNNEIAFKN